MHVHNNINIISSAHRTGSEWISGPSSRSQSWRPEEGNWAAWWIRVGRCEEALKHDRSHEPLPEWNTRHATVRDSDQIFRSEIHFRDSHQRFRSDSDQRFTSEIHIRDSHQIQIRDSDQRFTSEIHIRDSDQRFRSDLDQRFTSDLDQRFTSDLDQRFTSEIHIRDSHQI